MARCGSFSGSAKELFLTQPAISLRIKTLESLLGAQLFVRDSGRVIQLTPAGSRFAEFAQGVVELLQTYGHAEDRERIGAAEHSVLAVVSGPGIGKYLLPLLLVQVSGQCPETAVHLFQALETEIADMVRSGAAEVGAVIESAIGPSFTKVPFMTDDPILVAPIGHPILLRSRAHRPRLDAFPFVALPPESDFRERVDDWASALGLRLNVVLESANADTLKGAVLSGLGVAVLPEYVVRPELLAGTLARVPTPTVPQSSQLCFFFDPKRKSSKAARVLLEIARTESQ